MNIILKQNTIKKTTKNWVYVLFFLLPFSLSAQTAEEIEIKQVIQKSFDEIWSALDTDKMENYYTDDFLLLEDGEF